MPTVNIFRSTKEFDGKLQLVTSKLKEILAKELSGSSISLSIDEISVRLIDVIGDGMLARVELEINAAAFDERVKRQDEICLVIQKYLKDALNTPVNVWLVLSELGHSWESA